MKAADFCYWLQGFFEIQQAVDGPGEITPKQAEIVQRHLSLVFKHELDKQHGTPEEQAELQKIHDGNGGDGPLMRC